MITLLHLDKIQPYLWRTMKITIDIGEDNKDKLLEFLRKNSFSYEVLHENDIPQWQVDVVRERLENYHENSKPAKDVLKNLKQ